MRSWASPVVGRSQKWPKKGLGCQLRWEFCKNTPKNGLGSERNSKNTENVVLEVREFLKMWMWKWENSSKYWKCGPGSERIPENHLKTVLDVNCDEEIPKNTPKMVLGVKEFPKAPQNGVVDVREFLRVCWDWVWGGREFQKPSQKWSWRVKSLKKPWGNAFGREGIPKNDQQWSETAKKPQKSRLGSGEIPETPPGRTLEVRNS